MALLNVFLSINQQCFHICKTTTVSTSRIAAQYTFVFEKNSNVFLSCFPRAFAPNKLTANDLSYVYIFVANEGHSSSEHQRPFAHQHDPQVLSK